MRVQTDDDVYAVDNHWLGPPGRTFAWRARYSAYGVFGAVLLLVLAVERRAAIGFGFWSFTFPTAAVVTDALLWLQALSFAGWQVVVVILLAAVTLLVTLIAIRSLMGVFTLARRRAGEAALTTANNTDALPG